MNCTGEDKFTGKDGHCCDRCAAGSYMRAECDGTRKTECDECGRGQYTAAKNHLDSCQTCTVCNSSRKLRKFKDCTAQENTVCECFSGYFCSNDQCDHCTKINLCQPGEGVKLQATRTTDVTCAPCEEGTYSNVTDFDSPCRTHTRCEDIGRVLITPGTTKNDSICGNFKSNCPWMIPAGLWVGLVLTALIVFGLLCWKSKRRSHRTVHCVTCAATSSVPVSLFEMRPAEAVSLLKLPLPSTEVNGHCQESCVVVEDCKLTLFNPDDSVVSSVPISALRSASVSFAENGHTNGSVGHFLRSQSEPQEDEWCGT